MPMSRWSVRAAVVTACVAVVGLGCQTLGLESTGSINVNLTVTGEPGVGDFEVRWNDRNENVEGQRVIDPGGSLTFSDVPTGETEVTLVAMPDNCSTDDVQRIVNVSSDGSQQAGFEVTCATQGT